MPKAKKPTAQAEETPEVTSKKEEPQADSKEEPKVNQNRTKPGTYKTSFGLTVEWF